MADDDDDDDAGPSAEPDDADTGAPPADTGAPPADTGAPPADTGAPPAVEEDRAPAVLGAMATRMHSNRRLEPGEDGRIRDTLGGGDDAVLVVDDGSDHCMIGHAVGQAPDGCVYCLVARISLDRYADAVSGDVDPTELFSDARDVSLCGVIEEDHEVTNVFLVQHYRRARDVPVDYLPGSPFLEFTDDLDEEA